MSRSHPRRLLVLGALCATVGLAVAATAPIVGVSGSERTAAQQLVGGIMVVAGWALLSWGIHRFGRDPED